MKPPGYGPQVLVLASIYQFGVTLFHGGWGGGEGEPLQAPKPLIRPYLRIRAPSPSPPSPSAPMTILTHTQVPSHEAVPLPSPCSGTQPHPSEEPHRQWAHLSANLLSTGALSGSQTDKATCLHPNPNHGTLHRITDSFFSGNPPNKREKGNLCRTDCPSGLANNECLDLLSINCKIIRTSPREQNMLASLTY